MREPLDADRLCVFFENMDERAEEVTRAMHVVAGEARTIGGAAQRVRLAGRPAVSAADMVVFPGIMLLLRAMEKREAGELRSRFLPMETTYPAIARWIRRVEALPGYDRQVHALARSRAGAADRDALRYRGRRGVT